MKYNIYITLILSKKNSEQNAKVKNTDVFPIWKTCDINLTTNKIKNNDVLLHEFSYKLLYCCITGLNKTYF